MYLLQVAMSKFDKDSNINYEKMAENLKIVRHRLDCVLVCVLCMSM